MKRLLLILLILLSSCKTNYQELYPEAFEIFDNLLTKENYLEQIRNDTNKVKDLTIGYRDDESRNSKDFGFQIFRYGYDIANVWSSESTTSVSHRKNLTISAYKFIGHDLYYIRASFKLYLPETKMRLGRIAVEQFISDY